MKYFIDYRISGDFVQKVFDSEAEQLKEITAYEGTRKGNVKVEVENMVDGNAVPITMVLPRSNVEFIRHYALEEDKEA